jgi:hypothetical protein
MCLKITYELYLFNCGSEEEQEIAASRNETGAKTHKLCNEIRSVAQSANSKSLSVPSACVDASRVSLVNRKRRDRTLVAAMN